MPDDDVGWVSHQISGITVHEHGPGEYCPHCQGGYAACPPCYEFTIENPAASSPPPTRKSDA